MLLVLMDSSPETQATLTDLITNPDYYLWRFEGTQAIFARMNRETYKKSIFTDQRIIALDPKPIRVDLNTLLHAFKKQKYKTAKLSYIFHVAHCGSTLLSRAMDLESHNIVYREPFVLRQLSVALAENAWNTSPCLTSITLSGLTTIMMAG